MGAQQTDEAKQRYKLRKAGHLPTIDILGTLFWVEWGTRELQQVDVPWNTIDLMRAPRTKEGDGFLIRYDPDQKIGYVPGERIWGDPQRLTVLRIPHENVLDPYLVAKLKEINPLQFIKQHPIIPNLKATDYWGEQYERKNAQQQSSGSISLNTESNENIRPDSDRKKGRGR